MRVALVHDYLTHLGGAERVLGSLMQLYPNAPVYTTVYDKGAVGSVIDERRVRYSFLQQFPGARKPHRYFPLALMPLAVEQFDLKHYDLVLSASHSFSKGIITAPQTMHMSYCFTPTRYAWDDSHRYVREFAPGRMFQSLAPLALSYIRLWDFYAAQRVYAYITLSEYVAKRIKKYYRRQATVVAPPVNLDNFSISKLPRDGYFLVVSRLVPYKRIELAIDACEKLGCPLKIVGVGPEEKMLRKRAKRWTSFLGFVPDNKLSLIYRGASALLFPQEEDFGITTLEAAASGRPTIAYGAGGALETIEEGVTGVFFNEQNVFSLIEGIRQWQRIRFDPARIRKHAEKYSEASFMRGIEEVVSNEYCAWQRRGQQ
jgi:glycosyltransferase involved in cell wall biosynthesis